MHAAPNSPAHTYTEPGVRVHLAHSEYRVTVYICRMYNLYTCIHACIAYTRAWAFKLFLLFFYRDTVAGVVTYPTPLSIRVRVQSVYVRERTMFLSRPLPRGCVFSHVCIRRIGRRTESEREGRDGWIVTCRSDVYIHTPPPRTRAFKFPLLFFLAKLLLSLILRNVSRL